MDASELENLGLEYSEQFEKYRTLIRGIRQLSDSPEQLPKSLKFLEPTGESLRLSFVGRFFTIYHESDIPKSALWSKIMVAMDETVEGKTTQALQGFLRIDRGGNVKPDTAMSSTYTVENPKEVLMMLLELGVT
jgi:hypothetical protein